MRGHIELIEHKCAHNGVEGGELFVGELRFDCGCGVFGIPPCPQHRKDVGRALEGLEFVFLRAGGADDSTVGGAETRWLGASALDTGREMRCVALPRAEEEFRPEDKLNAVTVLFCQIEQFFVEFKLFRARRFFGDGFIEKSREIRGGLHGAPVGVKSGASMEQGTLFSGVEGVGAFFEIE